MYNWLISGSLLGWYRQCGAIPYTSDADTATWASDFKPWMRDYFLGPDKSMRNYFPRYNLHPKERAEIQN